MAADPRDAARPFDAYAVLGLDPTASTDDIRRAYRRLARALHPDANPGDVAAAERFRRVADAHALLSDPLRRARYDLLRGHSGHSRPPVGPRPVRQGPSPSGNTAVRGLSARPSHHPREAPRPEPRREIDEWSFLGRFVRWAAVAVTATALAALLLLIAASRAEPTPPPPQTVPRGVPGGAGFCQVPEGWVACQLVSER